MNDMDYCPKCASKNMVIILMAGTLAMTAVKLNQHTGFLDRAWEFFKLVTLNSAESIEQQVGKLRWNPTTTDGKENQ